MRLNWGQVRSAKNELKERCGHLVPSFLQKESNLLTIGTIVSQIYLWISLFINSRPFDRGIGTIVPQFFNVAMFILLLFIVPSNFRRNMALIAYVLSFMVVTFATIYFGYGTTENYNIWLSRLDAIYFSIGTLTTAGTGNIVATSELSRLFQTLQMVLGFILVVFAVSIVISRISSFRTGNNHDE